MIDKTIPELFKTRDKAIATRDRKLFLSTQTGEIINSYYESYAKIDKLRTEVFSIFSEKEMLYNRVVFGRETYFPKEKDSYSTFAIFYLIDTKDGWKIYRLAY